jgi:DNA-binding NtrC family response regulator
MTRALLKSESPRFRVLVVDDERTVLEGIGAVLEEAVDVVCCTSAAEALKAVETQHFDVVCSDYKMPGKSGLDLLNEISASSRNTGYLLLTGAEDYVRRRGSSGYYVMLKPFDPERLIALVLQLARLAAMKSSVHELSARSKDAKPGRS